MCQLGIPAVRLIGVEAEPTHFQWMLEHFRDNHLVPEMKEPATPMKTELKKVRVAEKMAWAYTHSEFPIKTKAGVEVTATLWSVYVLEKQSGTWKVVLLDWSIHVPR